MTLPFPQLALAIDRIKPRYDVVVIGSGYGGGIAASRLSRAARQDGTKPSVCVLERGREIHPGEFPDTPMSAQGEMHIEGAVRLGKETALFDLHLNEDIHVLVGCGLGGTSLINANAAILPDPRVFSDPGWPQEIRDEAARLLDLHAADTPTLEQAADLGLAAGFHHAVEMLRPAPYPLDQPTPAKLRVLEAMAASLKAECTRPLINVHFGAEGNNHAGVPQGACDGCGDCMTGCNRSAKNSVLMNYLPDAKAHGAEIYTRIRVSHLSRPQGDGDWRIHFRVLESGQDMFDAPEQFVDAGTVVLGAGSLGSTEILLRSRLAGLTTSPQLGRHFTANGDVLAFGYNLACRANGIGTGRAQPNPKDPVGPCITGLIDLRGDSPLDAGMVIEEGTIPGALAAISPAVLQSAAALVGRNAAMSFTDRVKALLRRLDSWLRGSNYGATAHTQTLLVMAHDQGSGQLALEDERLAVVWPHVGEEEVFERIDHELMAATAALGGVHVKNPIWSKLMGKQVVTVHPLGGCAMGADAAVGVVNHCGQVYSGETGSAVHDGLYVTDGAVIRRPLGVNPLLTISALAERSCSWIARNAGWQIDYAFEHRPLPAALPERRTAIRFTERMVGFATPGAELDFGAAEERDRTAQEAAEFVLTVEAEDVEALLANPGHCATLTGTVTLAALSREAMSVSAGRFELFPTDACAPGARLVRYRMRLTAVDGQSFWFEGFKKLRDDPGSGLWHDATTLYVAIHDGANDKAPLWGKGILNIEATDLLKQLRTIEVSTVGYPWFETWQALATASRLATFIAGKVFKTQ